MYLGQDYQFRQYIRAVNVAELITYNGLKSGDIGYDSEYSNADWEVEWAHICDKNNWNPDNFLVEYICEPNPHFVA